MKIKNIVESIFNTQYLFFIIIIFKTVNDVNIADANIYELIKMKK